MMNHSTELTTILSEAFRREVEENRGREPLEVALDKHLTYASLVATQLKYLKRAESKLPSYAAAGCYLPPRAFEQSSSEAVAGIKRIEGERLLDLTCGLGVDSFVLARRFREVVSLERDPLLAAITQENMRRLGVDNVRVVSMSAEEFVATTNDHFDWIYADPDRRSTDGSRHVRLEDCSPNILALWPRLRSIGDRLCLKNSPLFDVDEARRLFPESRVEVISWHNECKEVMIYVDGSEPMISAEAVGVGRVDVPLTALDSRPTEAPFNPSDYPYLVIPDVALQKARLVCHHLRRVGYVASENGYAFLREPCEGVVGRTYAIEEIVPYSPKEIKRQYKGRGAELLKHDFPYTIEEIRRQTGLKVGAELRWAFTRIEGRLWSIRLRQE